MQTHRDQLFFEAVYSALAAVIHEALGSFKTRQEVDVEVGLIAVSSSLSLFIYFAIVDVIT